MRIWLAIVVLGGCALDNSGDRGDEIGPVTPPGSMPTGKCPSGETCSSATPDGLQFVGAQPVCPGFPNGTITTVNHQIASGGTHTVEIRNDNNTPFTLPFEAETTSPVTVVDTTGTTVTLKETEGQGYLRIVDENGELYDREAYASSSLYEIVPVPVSNEDNNVDAPPSGPFAFAVGSKRVVGLALLDFGLQQHRLIDTSLVLTGGTQTHWDQIELNAPTAGTYMVTAMQHNIAHQVPITVVDKADEIVAMSSKGSLACFAAMSNGVYVANANWHFTIGGIDVAPANDFGPNCVLDIFTPTFTVTASALGKSLTITTTN